MRAGIRGFRRDRRGVGALEFALIAPVLLLLLVGMNEIVRAQMVQRKVTHVASAIGDLAAQSQTVDLAKLDDFFAAGHAILGPYDNQDFEMRLTAVALDQNGSAQVKWSVGKKLAPMTGAVNDVPAGLLAVNGDMVILAETTYDYSSPFGVSILGFEPLKGLKFSDKSYLKPRYNTVACDDCPQPQT